MTGEHEQVKAIQAEREKRWLSELSQVSEALSKIGRTYSREISDVTAIPIHRVRSCLEFMEEQGHTTSELVSAESRKGAQLRRYYRFKGEAP